MPRGRRLLPIASDVVEDLQAVARRMGLSVSEIAELILRRSAQVLRTRSDVLDALVEPIAISDLHRLGAIFVPVEVLSSLINTVDEDGLNNVISRYASWVKMYVNLLRVKGADSVLGVNNVVSLLLPFLTVDVYDAGNGDSEMVVSSPLISDDRMSSLVLAILKTVVEGLGYKVKHVEHSEGVIAVRYCCRRGGSE